VQNVQRKQPPAFTEQVGYEGIKRIHALVPGAEAPPTENPMFFGPVAESFVKEFPPRFHFLW